jgi:hypothetical protein
MASLKRCCKENYGEEKEEKKNMILVYCPNMEIVCVFANLESQTVEDFVVVIGGSSEGGTLHSYIYRKQRSIHVINCK